jgi:hypothetical protein
MRDEGRGARGETSNRLNVLSILGFPSSLTPHPPPLITIQTVTSNLRFSHYSSDWEVELGC